MQYLKMIVTNSELTFIGRVTVMVSIVVPIPPPLQLKNEEKRELNCSRVSTNY